ncbi:hypothetical protein ACFE04_003555 [Oxalis oulophora]
MARCFPFPSQLCYVIRDEPLIEPIKFKAEPAKKRKEEKKREEKRHDKKKRHTEERRDVENNKHKHKRRRQEERCQEDQVTTGYGNKTNQEVRSLEDSTLTEERGQPAGSYDSTASTDNPHTSTGEGVVCRIRSSSTQRQNNPEALLPIKQHSSLLGRTKIDDASSVRVTNSKPCSISGNLGPEPTISLSKSKTSTRIPSLTGSAEPLSNLPASCRTVLTSGNVGPTKSKPLPSASLKDCAKPPSEHPCSPPVFDLDSRGLIPPALDEDADSWLFETKRDQNRKTNKNNEGSVATGLTLNVVRSPGGFPVPYPRAQYLPEAGIYALPYVLPY